MGETPSQEVTFLFSSIEGSSKQWEQQPEAFSAALACHDALLATALWVKMTLDSGAAEMRDDGSYFAPHTLNRISRLLAVAHGGQIIVSAATAAQLDNPTADYTLRDLGERQLRDLSAPLRLYQIVAPGLAAGGRGGGPAGTRIANSTCWRGHGTGAASRT